MLHMQVLLYNTPCFACQQITHVGACGKGGLWKVGIPMGYLKYHVVSWPIFMFEINILVVPSWIVIFQNYLCPVADVAATELDLICVRVQ